LSHISQSIFILVPDFTGNADMPYDFFLTRYVEAYVEETIAFCQSLVDDTAVPCTGEDGLVALIMSIAADKSAKENRWVKFSEIVSEVYCVNPTQCELVAASAVFPQEFRPTEEVKNLLVPNAVEDKKPDGFLQNLMSKINL
jgi:myo-inositol 2-dehydrogenase/D-chiro-inositol 1-dehydrogenase